MKNKFSISVVAILLFFCLNGMAQSVLVVQPGVGTLNTAVNTYKGEKIYQLKAGEWYGLNAPIENVNYHLQIIGAEPAVAGGMPATLQTGSATNGNPFVKMFDAKGDITIKNIYVVNADLNAQVGNEFIIQSTANTRIIIDRCVIHPASSSSCIDGKAANIKTYFTNNQVIDQGHQIGANDGHFFIFTEPAKVLGVDTLLVENNTFVCMGMGMFRDNGVLLHNYVNFNHNTFVLTKSQLNWAVKKMEDYWTNNLMFNVNTQPYSNSWQPMPGGDVSRPKPNLIYADTLPNEVLPSSRPSIVQYNSHYRAQGFYDLITELNIFAKTKSLPNVYLFPLVWPKDSVNCREAQMFNSTGFPKFKYGNNMTDVNPQWVDTKIYEHEANFVKWSKPASYIHAMAQPSGNYPSPTAWSQYWWIPSGDLSNNSVWPVFNGKYTNPQTLTGSIEGLPLGDLNWFPTQKALWLSKKPQIEAHIKAGNTEKINLTAISNIHVKSTTVYPNPAKNEVNIKGVQNAEITILSLDGRILKSVKNVTRINVSDIANGSYLITVKEGNTTSTEKLIIQK